LRSNRLTENDQITAPVALLEEGRVKESHTPPSQETGSQRPKGLWDTFPPSSRPCDVTYSIDVKKTFQKKNKKR